MILIKGLYFYHITFYLLVLFHTEISKEYGFLYTIAAHSFQILYDVISYFIAFYVVHNKNLYRLDIIHRNTIPLTLFSDDKASLSRFSDTPKVFSTISIGYDMFGLIFSEPHE